MATKMMNMNVKKFVNNITNMRKLAHIEMPQRFKGTIIEKWVHYWKQLCIDYKEAGVSFIDEAKTKPIKGTIFTLLGAVSYLCIKKNPNEIDFIEHLRTYNNDLMLVHESCHKPESSLHLKSIERCLNEGVLRRLSLGFISFMWIADYDKNVAAYKAICPHLQPEYMKFHNRIIDIGFWNKWWKLENKMKDYDVNI